EDDVRHREKGGEAGDRLGANVRAAGGEREAPFEKIHPRILDEANRRERRARREPLETNLRGFCGLCGCVGGARRLQPSVVILRAASPVACGEGRRDWKRRRWRRRESR